MDLFKQILEEELVSASGCTEPIALAFGGALCKKMLEEEPTKILVKASGNIIKNVKGVTIPNTKDLRGIRNSVILGSIVGEPDRNLEVLSNLTNEQIELAKAKRAQGLCTVELLETDAKLHFEIHMEGENNTAVVEIIHTHTNIQRLEKNGKEVYFNSCNVADFNSSLTSRETLSIKSIYKYIRRTDITKLEEILDRQFKQNYEIAKRGLSKDYGLNTGKIILKYNSECLKERVKAYASSGSDARMNGCSLPVIINSGSGNQGMTISNSLYVFCKEKNVTRDKTLRALAFADLIAIHIKTNIGRLSALCGAMTASVGVAAAMSYIETNDLEVINKTIKNCIGNLTGIICDGAKSSCALKIASCVDAAILAHQLAMNDYYIGAGIGIVDNCVEKTISNLSNIASISMLETDNMILDIMTNVNTE